MTSTGRHLHAVKRWVGICLWLTSFALAAVPIEMAPNGSFEFDRNRDDLPDGWKPALFDSPAIPPQPEGAQLFRKYQRPGAMGQYPMVALLFHRRDVAPARNTVVVAFSNNARFAPRPRRADDPCAPCRVITWISRVRNLYYDRSLPAVGADLVLDFVPPAADFAVRGKRVLAIPGVLPGPSPAPDSAARKLHGRLLEAYGRLGLPGVHRPRKPAPCSAATPVNSYSTPPSGDLPQIAPRVRIAAGFCSGTGAGETIRLGDIRIICRTPFAAISVICLDDAPDVRHSRRLLITAVARAENTGQATIATGAERRQARAGGGEARTVDADTGGFLPQTGSVPIRIRARPGADGAGKGPGVRARRPLERRCPR